MSNFQIEDFAPVAKANPYTEAVQALIEAGEGKALTITAPRGTKRNGDPGDGQADKLKFQQAANDQGYTARVRKTEDTEDGNVRVTFTLTAKHNRGPRNPAEGEATEGESVETVEAVESVEGEAEAEGDAGSRRRRR